MKFLKILAIFIVSLCVLPGCFQKYEIDDFKSTENKFDWGSVSVKLEGEMKLKNNIAVRNAPYELLIWFEPDAYIGGIIKISRLKLIYAKSGKVVFERNDIPEQYLEKNIRVINKPEKKIVENYLAYFSFKNISMEYSDAILQMDFILKQGGKSVKYNSEIYFEKDYKEFKMMKGA